MDVNVIIKMAFFIKDLHRHIEKLYKAQFGGDKPNEIFTIYRGQELFKEDFQ